MNFIKGHLGIVFILLIWSIFASPLILKNLAPFPSDYLVSFFSPWSAYGIGGPVKNDAMPDVIGQIYPWRYLAIETFKSGEIPLWNPYSFSGTPHLANYQSAVLNPLNLGFFVFPFLFWWSTLILLQPLLAGIFTYMHVKSLKKSEFAAAASSLSFMFCGFMTSWMAYGTLGYAILYLPLALFSIEKYVQQKSFRYLVLLFLTVPLSFFSGHFQTSLYYLIFILSYILFKFLQTKNTKTISYLTLSLLFSILFCAPQLFPSFELYSQSFRSTIIQKIEFIPWEYLPTLFAPDFYGNPVTRNTIFGHYAEWNMYFGLVPLMLTMYSLFKIKNSYIKFFILTGTISFLLALDSPLQNLLVGLKVPVLSTSALSRIIVLFAFSSAILSGFGLDFLSEDIKNKRFRKLFIVMFITIIIFGSFWIFSSSSVTKSNLKFPSLILIAFLALIISWSYLKKIKNSFVLASFLILLLISIDMLRFVNKWMPFSSSGHVYPEVEVIKKFHDIKLPDRVFANFGGEGTVYYKLLGVEGYDAVYIRRYGQFISSLQKGNLSDAYRSVVEYPLNGDYSLLGANFLGIKYFIHKVSDGQNVWEFPFWKYKPKTLKLIFDDKKYEILENKNSFPRAFLVSTVSVRNEPQKILDTMFNPRFNLRENAVVEENLNTYNKLGTGSATITTYSPNKVVINTTSSESSFLVLTDSFYPGWNAYVDGDLTKVYRTDFAFRGVEIPSGKHVVEFKYEPKSFMYGVYVAIIGLLLLICLGIYDKHNNNNK